MSGGFNNQIIGGLEKLIRDAIQSPNYVAGATGWSINKDGSAEFNNGTFRGTIIIGAAEEALLIYRGTPGLGTLEFSVSALTVNVFDDFGNVVPPGITIFDPGTGFATLKFNGDGFGQLLFNPATGIFTLDNGVGAIMLSAALTLELDAASVFLNPSGAGVQIASGQIGKVFSSERPFSKAAVPTNTATDLTSVAAAIHQDSDYPSPFTAGVFTPPVNSFYDSSIFMDNPGTGIARCTIKRNGVIVQTGSSGTTGESASCSVNNLWLTTADTVSWAVTQRTGANQTVTGIITIGRRLA